MRFDSYYDPPDDPPLHPLAEEAAGLLDDADVSQPVVDRILAIIDDLVAASERACPRCEAAAAKAEREAEESAARYWAELPADAACPHGEDFLDCPPCLRADDHYTDMARERRMWR